MRLTVIVIVLGALGLMAAPAVAAEGSFAALAVLQRDLGLSSEQADAAGRAQDRAIELDAELRSSLGDAYAGARFDVGRGVLIVNVTDAALLARVQASGAEPRLVRRSLAELGAITAELDAAGGVSRERRAGARPRRVALTSWSIDPAANAVHVTATRDQAAAAREQLARYGAAVTLEVVEEAPEPLTRPMEGGDAIQSHSCSAGFNLRNPSTGKGYLLTAGHCVDGGETLVGHGPTDFGLVLESWFPFFDDALARNDNTSHWLQGPWVDIDRGNGDEVIEPHGYTDAPVGTIMCSSGKATGWRCGLIRAKNVTVTYKDGSTVHGLTRHSACVEHGDSGGSNVSFSFTYGFRAEGVTSGGRARNKNGWPRCLEVFGEENESYYFPVANSLAYYGPRYGVVLW